MDEWTNGGIEELDNEIRRQWRNEWEKGGINETFLAQSNRLGKAAYFHPTSSKPSSLSQCYVDVPSMCVYAKDRWFCVCEMIVCMFPCVSGCVSHTLLVLLIYNGHLHCDLSSTAYGSSSPVCSPLLFHSISLSIPPICCGRVHHFYWHSSPPYSFTVYESAVLL